MARVDSNPSDPGPDAVSGEDLARVQQAEDNAQLTDAPDPTGGKPDQIAAKQAATALGDQEAINQAGPTYPATAHDLTPENVRRYPELFTQEQIDSFIVDEHLGNRGHEDQAFEDTTNVTTEPVQEAPTGEVNDALREGPSA